MSCLAVTGNTAIIGFTSLPGLSRTLIRVTDGGGAAGDDSFAAVTQLDFPPPDHPIPPPDCSAFPPTAAGEITLGGSGVNDIGDIVVTDAQPFPTSKDQCKKGGWRNFPGFKNQGQCVSFVATGGKKQP